MPVKWTPEMDQLLLLKILETCEVNADAKKISGAWPTDCPSGLPTPRAITERLVKIREAAKKNGAGHFNISSAQSKGTGPKRVGTPRKPRANNNSATPGSAGKRKRGGKDTNGNVDDEEGFAGVKMPKEEDGEEDVFWMGADGMGTLGLGNGGGGSTNADGNGVVVDEESCMADSPVKRAKREGTSKADGYGSDGQAGGESSVSEFADVA